YRPDIENNLENVIPPRYAREQESREKLLHIPTAKARDIASVLRDRTLTAIQESPPDKGRRAILWSSKRRPNKSKMRRTRHADAAAADNQTQHKTSRPR